MELSGSGARSAICAVTLICAVGSLTSCGLADSTSPSTANKQYREQQVAPPLDDIPGLGTSQAGALRDDIVAYWEAWRRDSEIAECMRGNDFDWQPEVLYPDGSIVAIASALDLTIPDPPHDLPLGPEDLNRQYEDQLNEVNRDSYLRILTGESAADIDYAREHDAAPEGRDPATFAEGGCRGSSQRDVGSIWTLKRSLSQALLAFHAETRQTEAFQQEDANYESCVSSFGFDGIWDPSALEDLASGSPDVAVKLAEIDATCRKFWTRAYPAGGRVLEPTFRTSQADAIESQVDKYSGVVDRIRGDEAFLQYAADAASVAEARLQQ